MAALQGAEFIFTGQAHRTWNTNKGHLRYLEIKSHGINRFRCIEPMDRTNEAAKSCKITDDQAIILILITRLTCRIENSHY